MKDKWITNLNNPNRDDYVAMGQVTSSGFGGDTYFRQWLSKHRIGLPRATEKYGVEELIGYHMVGIYEKEN